MFNLVIKGRKLTKKGKKLTKKGRKLTVNLGSLSQIQIKTRYINLLSFLMH